MESAGTERLLGKRPRSLPPQATNLGAAKKPKIPRGLYDDTHVLIKILMMNVLN